MANFDVAVVTDDRITLKLTATQDEWRQLCEALMPDGRRTKAQRDLVDAFRMKLPGAKAVVKKERKQRSQEIPPPPPAPGLPLDGAQ